MPVLSDMQIAQLAYNAGFRGKDLNTAVAIALAESGGNTDAYNPEAAAGTAQGSGSRGLWQIYGTAHPKYNNSSAFDPRINAQAAYEVYRQSGGHFTPWSTYNLGWATPKQNYAAMIGGVKNIVADTAKKLTGKKTTGNQVKSAGPQQTLSQNLYSQLGGQGSSLQASGGAMAGATPKQPMSFIEWLIAEKNPDGKPKTGPKSPTDLLFIGLGSAIFIIGMIFLLVAMATTEGNKGRVSDAIKFGAQVAKTAA